MTAPLSSDPIDPYTPSQGSSAGLTKDQCLDRFWETVAQVHLAVELRRRESTEERLAAAEKEVSS